ncbi:hypothetical protein KIN20_025336 [Parelaphostrongylus tenuis]|uniref:Uncharacterized protein n=1 Tax=Parelaphostrongylus tenuis TaxID=148309 RepID=A0AAD5QUC5_PARTN|nr:hypothetical protein KIN20_025322 [Parelaphostrongylus tenuis]KAJ1365110.1 hypothetical protein KIN20_025336 [Parelaphostrongylus tenuis]
MLFDARQGSVPEDPTTNNEEVGEENNEASDKNAKKVGVEQIVVNTVSKEGSELREAEREQLVAHVSGVEQPVPGVASDKESSVAKESGDEQPIVDSTVDEGSEDDQTPLEATSETRSHQPDTEDNDNNNDQTALKNVRWRGSRKGSTVYRVALCII